MRRMLLIGVVGTASAGGQGPVPVSPSDMLHLLITQNGTSLDLSFETPVFDTPVLVDRNESYTGPGSVLSGAAYNSQYGWLANGFFNIPSGAAVWVAPVEIDAGLRFYDEFSFDPIHGTDGSDAAWRWTGQMTHNWVAATVAGLYEATFEVYFGDALTGAPVPGFSGDQVTLAWTLPGLPAFGPTLAGGSLGATSAVRVAGPVPAPGPAALAVVGLLGVRRRRPL